MLSYPFWLCGFYHPAPRKACFFSSSRLPFSTKPSLSHLYLSYTLTSLSATCAWSLSFNPCFLDPTLSLLTELLLYCMVPFTPAPDHKFFKLVGGTSVTLFVGHVASDKRWAPSEALVQWLISVTGGSTLHGQHCSIWMGTMKWSQGMGASAMPT